MNAGSEASGELGALIARARTGDRQALEALLAQLALAVHRFGLRMCRDAHDAEDVVQDTLLNVATHLGEFQGRSALSSWVFALARSACARKRRGLKNQPGLPDAQIANEPDRAPTPEAHAADRELTAALSRALDALPEEHREVILLRDVEGLSAQDAAGALGISVDALKSRLHRARQALRSALRPLLEPVAPPPTAACPDIAALWSKKLEGDLSQGDCSSMEQHMLACPSCTAACDALKQALLACRQVQNEQVPPELRERIKAALRAVCP